MNQEQLDEFLALAAGSIKLKSFSHFIREKACAYHDICPVLRSCHLPSGSEISNTDFSSTDMTRHIAECKSIQCIYNDLFDQNADLTDNYSFDQSAENLESMMSKLVETKAKKEAELTERLLKIETEMESLKTRRNVANSDIPCFYNVRDAVDDFSGRESVLNTLSEYFDDHDQSYAVAVIAAPGG